MKVGVYVDAFNLYYGGRSLCGRGAPAWRWLDIRSLANDLFARRRNWTGATIDRVIYCTALIDGASNPDGRRDQDVYLRAIQSGGVVDHVELGHYVARVKTAPPFGATYHPAARGPGFSFQGPRCRGSWSRRGHERGSTRHHTMQHGGRRLA